MKSGKGSTADAEEMKKATEEMKRETERIKEEIRRHRRKIKIILFQG
jgi:hypothetical protein